MFVQGRRVVDRLSMRAAAVPACNTRTLQVKLSLSDELMFAYMHYQLKGDWAAMEVKMHCRWAGHTGADVGVSRPAQQTQRHALRASL